MDSVNYRPLESVGEERVELAGHDPRSLAARALVPMMAPGARGQFALASHDETAPTRFVEDLLGGELEVELEHGGL
jgi:hypothetical protein